MSYIITYFDIINGEKTRHRILKPVPVNSIAEIDQYQARLQNRVQRLHTDTITVLVNYKCRIEEHIKHNK